MTLCNRGTRLAAVFAVALCVFAARPAPAEASFNPVGAVCTVVGLFSGLLGKGCNAVSSVGSRLISAAKDLFTGKIGSAVKAILGQADSALKSHAGTIVGLAAIGLWVIGGARYALNGLATVLGETTTPRLGSSWFSAAYWRMAGIAALMTLPFLFAAAIQAVLRSDLTLLLRSALGYLPLAILVVAIAAPITMLLLSASDELSSLVSSASGRADSQAFGLSTTFVGSLTVFSRSLFFACFFGILMVLGATALWIELVMREAAVYVVVLMLPLAFAALVWPARRTWAIRAVEVLVALILSKFVIVAVLALGGAAMSQIGHSVTSPIVGLVLVMMAVFAPWALLRLVPLSELASSASSSLRGAAQVPAAESGRAYRVTQSVDQWAAAATQSMSRVVDQALLPEAASDDPADGDDADMTPGGAGPGPEGLGGGDPGGLGPEADLGREAAMTGPASLDPDGPSHLGFGGHLSVAPGERGAVAGTPSIDSAGGMSGGDSPDRQERIPGLGPMWQADNFTWKPLTLGLEEDWPPTLWPPDGGSEGSGGANAGLPEGEAHLLPAGSDALAPDGRSVGPGGIEPVPPGDVIPRPQPTLPTRAGDPPSPSDPALARGPAPPPDPAAPPDPPQPPERPAGPGSLPPPPPHEHD
jgi:hypothetical protein